MMFFRWIEEPFASRRQPWYVPALAGALIIVLGLLIVAMPQILVALVAGFVLSAGLSLVVLGFQMRERASMREDERIHVYYRAGPRPRSFFD